MIDKAALVPEKIHLTEFRILKGQISSPVDFKIKRILTYRSDIGFDMAFNLVKKLIKADIQIKVQTESDGKNKEEADGFFHIAFFFTVENLGELTQESHIGIIEVHPGLANAIASITYSTARGVILSRFQGTALCDFILPVINPNTLLKLSVEAVS